MKYRIPLLASLIGASLLFAGAAMAQQQAMPPASTSSTDSTTFNAPQGQVTIKSTMEQTPSTASPPPFEQLSGGKKFITREQAKAYPPLDNDFDYANSAHNGRISKTEYANWLKNLN